MKLLVFDSSSNDLRIAVFENEEERIRLQENNALRAEGLCEGIRRTLEKDGLDIRQIDVIAVCKGPGSFTGLRVGVMTAKTLAWALSKPLVGVSRLEALAWAHARDGERLCVMLEAGREKVYAALYRRERGAMRTLKAPMLLTREQAASLCGRADRTLANAPEAPIEAVAAVAMARVAKLRYDKPMELEPQYLHPRNCNVT